MMHGAPRTMHRTTRSAEGTARLQRGPGRLTQGNRAVGRRTGHSSHVHALTRRRPVEITKGTSARDCGPPRFARRPDRLGQGRCRALIVTHCARAGLVGYVGGTASTPWRHVLSDKGRSTGAADVAAIGGGHVENVAGLVYASADELRAARGRGHAASVLPVSCIVPAIYAGHCVIGAGGPHSRSGHNRSKQRGAGETATNRERPRDGDHATATTRRRPRDGDHATATTRRRPRDGDSTAVVNDGFKSQSNRFRLVAVDWSLSTGRSRMKPRCLRPWVETAGPSLRSG
jgi:hypothetical protein